MAKSRSKKSSPALNSSQKHRPAQILNHTYNSSTKTQQKHSRVADRTPPSWTGNNSKLEVRNQVLQANGHRWRPKWDRIAGNVCTKKGAQVQRLMRNSGAIKQRQSKRRMEHGRMCWRNLGSQAYSEQTSWKPCALPNPSLHPEHRHHLRLVHSRVTAN